MKNSGKLAALSLKSPVSLITLGSVLVIFLISRIWNRKIEPDWRIIQNSEYAALLPYLKLQAKVESANYTSSLFKRTNNIFGMGCVRERSTTQIGCTAPVYDGNQKKGKYKSVDDSLTDQLLWLRARKFPLTVSGLDSFAITMRNKGYYTTPYSTYLKSLKSWQ